VRPQSLASLLGPRLRGDDKFVLAATIAIIACVGVAHADDSVGLWVKNTSILPVIVTVDGGEACRLEAPVYGPCGAKLDKKTAQTIKKYSEKKSCTVNSLKISCITNIPATGANVSIKRGDDEYKLRAAKGGTLYLCVEAKALTDCFGKKIQ
jgi:hypothetical protein